MSATVDVKDRIEGNTVAHASAARKQKPRSDVIASPSLGYFFDETSGGLRAVLGLPGSSIVGPPLDLGVAVTRLEISPLHDYALALAQRSAEALFVGLDRGRVSVERIPAVAAGADA